ncbi:hypothetical protein [Pontibacillus salipaludis]|uniref:Uncharacterized protein n=1 Tax=Pontibacillus salipaludis TaxID=1697394 RepID=A0ABQ1Q5S0_9BACI|nr:hypothetical protein [Pontibacillus salipaludis]GGD12934.1 hypothetical protein GCM10011389_20620 [Pontibacillus salipaludis]
MENMMDVWIENGYKVVKKTTKSIEIEDARTGEVAYVLPYKEMTLALNPKTVEADQELIDKSEGLTHNTSFLQFPKRQNTGKSLIQYGYAFKFQSSEEAVSFLNHVSAKLLTN